MSSQLSVQDREQIDAGIRSKYDQVAVTPRGHFKYPTGRAGLEGLHYDGRLLADLPDAVADAFCGVGNPFALGDIQPGAHVLDIGCGAGVDALLAGRLVGAAGQVLGIDLTAAMIAKAEANKEMMKAGNVGFRVAGVEELADMNDRFDVVISNGVFNLIPEKDEALAAALCALKPGGRLFIADQFLMGPISTDIKARVASWFQ
jgi:2-polyprenyl-3-methyl-5-hydroxy-6-metoxy-1,4-benzoquinol methylase